MIIKELYIAEFGAIKNKKIEFGDENMLNVIYGENESGKSTVFLFIKFMLYGLQRKAQTNTERERSLSWSGAVASGSLVLLHNGKEYRIERTFSDRARGEKLVILSLDSGLPISTDRSPGEYFLGVPREVFESSACVGQMRSSEINGEKTAQSLSNMLSSADESVDTASVLKELNTIRTSYLHKNQGGGSLYEDEARINSLRIKLDEARNASLAIEGKNESFEKIKKEYEALKIELEEKDALVTQFGKIATVRRFEALRQKESEIPSVVAKKSICAKAALKTEFFPDRTHVAELRASARELAETEERLLVKQRSCDAHGIDYDAELALMGEMAEKSGGRDAIISPINEEKARAEAKKKTAAIFAISALAVAVFGVIALIFINFIVGIAAFCACVALGAISIAVLVGASKIKVNAASELLATAKSYKTTPERLADRIDEALKELAKMRAYNSENVKLFAEVELALENYEGARERAYKRLVLTLGESAEPEIEVIKSEADRLSAFLDEYDLLKNEESAFLKMVENEKNALARYDEQKLRSEITVSFEAATQEAVDEAERSKSFLLAKRSACESKINLLQNELITLRIKAEDPLPIADRLAQLEEKVKKDRAFYDALILAMTTIEDSSAAMRGNVTPIISKMASELISRISGDRYNVLRTNSRLGVMIDKDGFSINSELLSAGTKDAAYLALRIALIMQIYDNERPPIIFDESLCQLDDTRLARVMELLYSLCEEGVQIIFFTSHKREIECCEQRNFKYNRISL